MKKHTYRWLFAIILVVILAIGIPVGINEAYKADCGYITIWGAEDVLAYYGALLGATATAGALVLTIFFTRKQILRESYLKSETDKWAKTENVIGNILNEINPMPALMQVMDTGFTDPHKAINSLQKYQICCRMTTDQLMACVNTADYVKIEELIKHIADISDKLFQVSQKEVDQYNKQQQLKQREITLKLLSMEKQNPGSLPAEEIAKYQETIKNTDEICFEDIEDAVQQLNEEFVRIYETDFRVLLQLKGATFESINVQTRISADAILSLWRK